MRLIHVVVQRMQAHIVQFSLQCVPLHGATAARHAACVMALISVGAPAFQCGHALEGQVHARSVHAGMVALRRIPIQAATADPCCVKEAAYFPDSYSHQSALATAL